MTGLDDDSPPSSPTPNTPRPKRGAGRNLPVAIASAVVLLAWIFGTLLWWQWGFVIFLMAAVVVGTYEVTRALGKLGMHAVFTPIAVGAPLVFAASYWLARDGHQLDGVAAILAGLALMIVACLVGRLRGPVRGFAKDAAASVFTVGYLPLLLSTLTLLLAQRDGNLRVIYFFILLACSDTGAYAFGSFFGKHKMAPHISPGKTWEGLAGGVVLSMAVGSLLGVKMLGAQWWAGILIGLLLALAGATGDLVESMIKRDTGLKDMGRIVPGHGGAMDRLDSLLVAAPFAWGSMLALLG